MESWEIAETPARKQSQPDSEKAPSKPSISAVGNAAVQRMLPVLRSQLGSGSGAVLDESITRAIQSQRGGGHTLDDSAKDKLEGQLGQDFSDVRIHTDSQANDLSRSVQAEAFTTGSDIFFKDGKYSPGTTEGSKLLAHELTHVVQQRGAQPAAELRVSDPSEASEVEASSVADSVQATSSGESVSRQASIEEDDPTTVAPKLENQELSREVSDDEDEDDDGAGLTESLAASFDKEALARQAEDEEIL